MNNNSGPAGNCAGPASHPRPGFKSLQFAASQIWTKGEDLVMCAAGVAYPTASDVAAGTSLPPPAPASTTPPPSSSPYAVASAILPHSPHVYSLFAVFDGHAGASAARHCAREVAAAVYAALPPGGPPPGERDGCGCADCCGAVNGGAAVSEPHTPGASQHGASTSVAEEEGGAGGTDDDAATATAAALAWRSGLQRALTCALHTLHLSWAAHGRTGGCTATLVLQAGRLLTVANVGDSHAALDLPAGGGVLALTGDHRVDGNAVETGRVRAAGGRVTNVCPSGRGPAADPKAGVGPLRVWAAAAAAGGGTGGGGGMANARAVGDMDLPFGLLLPTPALSQVRLPLEGARLLLASDGVWDALGMGRVARAARPHAAPEAADAVITAALVAQGHVPRDDASIIIIDLLPPGVPSFPEAAGRRLKRSASRAAALTVAGSPESVGGWAAGAVPTQSRPRPSTEDEGGLVAAGGAAAAAAAAAGLPFGVGLPKGGEEDAPTARRGGCCFGGRGPATVGDDDGGGGGQAASSTLHPSPPRRPTSASWSRDFTMHGGRAAFKGESDHPASEPSVRGGTGGGGGGPGRSGGFFADLSIRGGTAFFSGGGAGATGTAAGTHRAKADILIRLDMAVALGQLAPSGPGGSLRGGSGGGSEPPSAEGTAHGDASTPPAAWLDEGLRAALLATQEDAARLYAAASMGRSTSPLAGRKVAGRARSCGGNAVFGGPLFEAVARLRLAEAAALLRNEGAFDGDVTTVGAPAGS